MIVEAGLARHRVLCAFRQLQLLHILGWSLIVNCFPLGLVADPPSTRCSFVLAHRKDASVCDRLPRSVRTELDEDAADMGRKRIGRNFD